MGEQPSHLVTQLLSAVRHGEPSARNRLWELVYDELRRMAAAEMAKEPQGLTLQPTALVHEAYVRLMGNSDGEFENRKHFFSAAAEAMRRILVDNARRRRRLKHGGPGLGNGPIVPADVQAEEAMKSPRVRVSLDECSEARTDGIDHDLLLGLNDALDWLDERHPDLGQVVKLRFFVGLTGEQTAEVLGVAARTVDDRWRIARALLHQAMR
jgi:RNA polymerase sigma factor (sigma-70 family)